MAINIVKADIKFKLDNTRQVKEWLSRVVSEEKHFPGNINIVFTSDNYLREINKEFLQKEYYTDVISFNYSSGAVVDGDILVSVERVKENSEIFSTGFTNELHRAVLHGLLHLLGYRDSNADEKAAMRHKEEQYLSARF